MRPRIVELLNNTFHTAIFTWLVPLPSVMYTVAVMAVLLVYMQRVRKAGISPYHASGAVLYAMLGGLLGSRIIYLLFFWRDTLANPAQIFSLSGGTISWGAYLGGILGFVFYFWRHQERKPTGHLSLRRAFLNENALGLRSLDIVGACLGLGIFFGRWACFLNGDDFGKLSNLPWAVQYPPGSYPYLAQYSAGLIEPGTSLSLPVHPVQLYLSLKGLILFVLLSWIYRHFKDKPGLTFGLFWLFYGILRFIGEFFRGDHPTVLLGIFDAAQVVCALVVMAVAGWLVYQVRTRKLVLQPGEP